MSRPSIAAYTYSHNTLRYRYPILEAVQSALLLADRVFWCDCDSTDGTWELAQAAAKADPRIEVMRHPWGDHYTVLPHVANELLEAIGTRYDWALQVQADEVLCEWTIEPFRRDLAILTRDKWQLARPFYRNFCPDYQTTFPFIYDRKPVLSRTTSGLRWDTRGDACSLVGAAWYDLSLEFHHYGKVQVGREREALLKELEFQAMYKDLGFPDAKFLDQRESGVVDYRKAFAGASFAEYAGPHPAVMLRRIMGAESA